MKKHFLLLVMALVSLTSWAQTATIGDVGLGKYTYGDASYPTPVVKDSEGAILTVKTHYTVSTDAYTDEACTKAITDMKTLKADGTKYYLKITGVGAYAGSEKAVYFTVEKFKLTVGYEAGALNRTYGDDPVALDPTKFLAPTETLPFGQVWTTVRKGSAPTSYSTADNNAGTGKAVTFVGGWTADNYDITYTTTLDIAQKDISKTAVITKEQGDVVYTGKEIAGAYTVLDKEGGITLTQAASSKADGDFYVSTQTNVTANFKPTIWFKGNYTGSKTVPTGFAVTAAPITVSLKKDIEVTYNNTDRADQTAAATFDYSGFVGDDVTSAAKLISSFTPPTSVAVDGEAINAGEYTLAIKGGSAGGNYEFKTYLPGKLTIKPAKLIIRAKDDSKGVGEADPKFELATVTFPAGITTDKVTGVTFSREANEEVGKYDIIANTSAAKVMRDPVAPATEPTEVTSNYTFDTETVKGQLTITKGGIVVTIKNAEKFYGQEDPEFTYVVTGLQDGDKLADFTIERDKSSKTPEAVGSYLLNATVANPNPSKYTSLTVVPAILTIKKAQLTFTMPAQNVDKGATATALKKDGIKVDGINNSDAAAGLYDLAFATSVVTSDNYTYATGYEATLTTEAQKSYEIIIDATKDPVITGTKIAGKLIVGTGSPSTLTFKTTDGDATATPAPIPSDYSQIQDHAGETQNVTLTINPRNARKIPASTTHKWAAQTWNTMVLPFEVKVRDISSALGYAIVNVVDPENTTEGNVQFKLEMDKVPANTPFCVKTDAAVADDYVIKFNNVKIVDGGEYPSVDAGMGYKFVGAYKTLTIDKTKSTYNFLRGDNAKWAHIGSTSASTWDVLPFDAYIELTAAAAARGVTFTFQELDGSYTAIKAITVENTSAEANAEGWYTLGGVKLNGAPSQKGVYINNGKKVVIK